MSTEALILRVLDMASSISTMVTYVQRASVVLQKAHAEGREITEEEWNSLDQETTNALNKFDSLIAEKSHDE